MRGGVRCTSPPVNPMLTKSTKGFKGSIKPTPVGACRSALRFTASGPAWLFFVDMATWTPFTRSAVEQLLRDELASCNADERAAYERIRTPLHQVSILRAGKIESIFVVGESDGHVLIFEDVEQGFEWCRPEHDGVIRSYGCSQAGLQTRIYEWLHNGRA